MAFNKYFQDELNYLREMGREFSNAYPALAPMLADRGGDPDVERLLEGFAFLTGRVREKLDDELPELMSTVSQLLFPQLIRPLPATSILEFQPLLSAVRDKRVVPRGTEVESVAIDGTRCRFRTTSDCSVAPLQLSKVTLQDASAGKQELRIELQVLQPGDLAQHLPKRLSFHLAGEPRDGLALLAHLAENVEEVVVFDLAKGVDSGVVLPARSFRPCGFDDDEALLPRIETAFPGFRLLQEYYVLPAKFAFFELLGLDAAYALGEVQRLGLQLRLKQRSLGVRAVGTEQLRLHCVPIVNVFETTAEPVRVTRGRQRYPIRPAGLPPGQGAVYSIQKVTTIARSGERVVIPPFLSFEHAEEMENRSRVFYTEHRRPAVIGEGADVLVSLGTAEDSGVVPDVEVLSIELLATNGPLANAVRVGEVREPTSSSPPYATFKNLSAATTFVAPPLGHDLAWRAMAHSTMNLRSLTEVEVLRTVLAVYNLQAIFDRQAARANELRIEALRSVTVRPAEKLYRGAVTRGVDIGVEVDESGFAGEGDIFLFGAILERVFAEYVTINSFSRTHVRGKSSNVEYRWQARSGSQTLL